jgi:glucose-6-phosphate 1-epimerase
MSSAASSNLVSDFSPNTRLVEGTNGLRVMEIINTQAEGRIFLQGAHVTHWKPAGAQPVLFVSQQSHFARGKAIRGGVPVCFPWFANRAGHPGSPAHGFVRSAEWAIKSVSENSDGSTTARFEFVDSEVTRVPWPHSFHAKYSITVGSVLDMSFEVENTGPEPLTYEAALHTYFTVSDASEVRITGLEGTEYIDKVDGFKRKQLGSEPLQFSGETDRVFVNTTSTTRLIDPGMNRSIVIEKTGSNTTVVWNPWIAKAKAMADFGDHEWPRMACIETANSGENSITLVPDQRHTMTARIRLEPQGIW